MGARSFEELRVYQRADELADLVWDIAGAWHVLARDTIGKQVIRSADSIGANIAEGHGRGSYVENRRLCASPGAHSTRHATGSAALSAANSCPNRNAQS